MHDCVLQYYLRPHVSTKQDTEHLNHFNHLRAKYFKAKKNVYLDFMSFLHIRVTQVVEILTQVRQEHTYSTWSISWVLMSWRREGPGHQQPWYLLCWTELIRSPHVKGYKWQMFLIHKYIKKHIRQADANKTLPYYPNIYIILGCLHA